MSNDTFNKALSNFTNDFASGGAIRHLADNGFTVNEIHGRLDYPTPVSKIAEIVWKHFLENEVILTEDPAGRTSSEKVEYVREQNSLGKQTFRRVVTTSPKKAADYVACDFGKKLYKDREAFEKELEILDTRDRDYILGLPWPLTTVWHIEDERMKRIFKKLKEQS